MSVCVLLLVSNFGDWLASVGANVHMKKLPKIMFHNLGSF